MFCSAFSLFVLSSFGFSKYAIFVCHLLWHSFTNRVVCCSVYRVVVVLFIELLLCCLSSCTLLFISVVGRLITRFRFCFNQMCSYPFQFLCPLSYILGAHDAKMATYFS